MRRRAPKFWQERSLRSHALLPAAALYRVATRARNACIFPKDIGVPVICVGNAVAGGAGKTPVALYVAALLQVQGKTPFFLSRGYGGTTTGPLLVCPTVHTAEEVGDEPLLLARAAPTVVAKNRVSGALYAVSKGANVIVMDDGFQNPSLRKTLSLLVVDGHYRFGNGRVMPAGPLREPVEEALSRAGAVVVMGGDISAGALPVFHGELVTDARAAGLQGRRVLGFAGIAQPEKFRRTLLQLGCEVLDFFHFPDHHLYTEKELEKLVTLTETAGAVLVTTAKDWVRIPPLLQEKIRVVEVKMIVTEAESFAALLAGAVA